MQAYQQNLAQLEANNAQVLGVSMDSTFANKAWADQLGVTFPLLSDRLGRVTREYGVFNAKLNTGRRMTFVVNLEGKIEHIQADDAAIDPSDTIAVCRRKKLSG
jgi:peroxiredoxin